MIKLKDASGWFAAGSRMLRAVGLLSDGAFRLFVYICLMADRNTGRFQIAQAQLARALGKSRNSVGAYLDELSREGVCVRRPAANQHQPGLIEVADDFWPYLKQPAVSTVVSVPNGVHSDASNLESAFIDQVRAWLLQFPIVRSCFGSADRKLAADLFRQGVTLEQIDRALLLGLARKYISSLNAPAATPIFSLSYFVPLLDEVDHTAVSDQYWEYLRNRIKHFNAACLARFQQGPAPSQPTPARSTLRPSQSAVPLSGAHPSPTGASPTGAHPSSTGAYPSPTGAYPSRGNRPASGADDHASGAD